MPLPSDLPRSEFEFLRQRDAAQRKYRDLVRRLGSVEFLGLVDVVQSELERRNRLYKAPDSGGRIGR